MDWIHGSIQGVSFEQVSIARPKFHLELSYEFYEHYLGLEQGEVLAQAAAGTNAEGSENVCQLLLIRLQPPLRVEVLRVGKIFLVVHVLSPSRHHYIPMQQGSYPQFTVRSPILWVLRQTRGKMEVIQLQCLKVYFTKASRNLRLEMLLNYMCSQAFDSLIQRRRAYWCQGYNVRQQKHMAMRWAVVSVPAMKKPMNQSISCSIVYPSDAFSRFFSFIACSTVPSQQPPSLSLFSMISLARALNTLILLFTLLSSLKRPIQRTFRPKIKYLRDLSWNTVSVRSWLNHTAID